MLHCPAVSKQLVAIGRISTIQKMAAGEVQQLPSRDGAPSGNGSVSGELRLERFAQHLLRLGRAEGDQLFAEIGAMRRQNRDRQQSGVGGARFANR
jgi:hypothetical protein